MQTVSSIVSVIDPNNQFVQLLQEFGCDLTVEIANKYEALKLCIMAAFAFGIIFYTLKMFLKFISYWLSGRAF